jgi:two-component system CheB/CheR fusion protein
MNNLSREKIVPIVGIGASAGGLEALKTMIANMAPDLGACYVIVQHLSPNQKSILHELLQGETDLPVTQIEDGEAITANHIFVVPPGFVASVEGDTLKLSSRQQNDTLHRPIDMFFSSIADSRGRDAYCVVLSGTGSDGSAGLKAVKANGGFALVQESKGARFPGMPDSAVATGLVDFILPVERIAPQLAEMMLHRQRLYDTDDGARIKTDIEAALPKFAARLADVAGNDFSDYKPGTLVRRIERRMSVLRIRSVAEMLAHLDDENEAHLLAQEFLIGVTQFFRDPGAFEVLRERVVSNLMDASDGAIRVWVPGCSTGEEVYSIAILFLEEMDTRKDRRVLQVFGTDIDTASLATARYGAFSASSVEHLPEPYLKKYFQLERDQYRANPKLRESCIFAPHNILQDPPFSRIDLISCRNLLIYLSVGLQRQIIPRFHFAIRDTGYLFLGPSESLSGEEGLFDVIDKSHRLFRKNAEARTSYSALLDKPRKPRINPRTVSGQSPAPYARLESSREDAVEREFIRSYAAPFSLLSATGEVLYLSSRMTELVQPSSGPISTLIDGLLAPELRVPVRRVLQDAIDGDRRANIRNVLVQSETGPRVYDVEAGAVGSDFILSLTEVRTVESGDIGEVVGQHETADRNILETENLQLRRQLSMIQLQHQTSGQELKSSNEELMSMNEELQSSNEELETSREELQSINEELETVNAELQDNNRLLTRANSDLKNLFESTDLAVLFLDRAFCVRNFTPSTARLFGIRDRDIGRPIADLSSRIDYPDLEKDAHLVDENLQPLEREVEVKVTGETFLLRIKPYRTTDNRLDGYVLSFVDITQRKHYEETLKKNEQVLTRQYAELENLYDTTPVGLSLVDRNLRYIRINDSLAQINGIPREDHIGKTFKELLPELEDELHDTYQQIFKTGQPVLGMSIEGETPAAPGEMRHWVGDFYPVWQDDEVFAVGTCVREVTEQARMVERIQSHSEKQKVLLGELQHRVKNTLATVSSISKLLLRGIDDPSEYQSRLEDRLAAMSRTHDLLTEGDWTSAPLSQILANETMPYPQGDRVLLRGPDLALSARATTSLGMAIHELITNAVKYGALSVDGGSVEIRTAQDASGDHNRAQIIWQERDGPEIKSEPERKGFGTVVLQRVLKSDLDAKITTDYARDGLRYEIRFDMEDPQA